MVRTVSILAFVAALCAAPLLCAAEHEMPWAPASVSWLPHGYGENMWIQGTPWSNRKGIHGFRSSPVHIGSWSQPLWGWDVNGFYRGPQVPSPDPANCQLPIGLIYPDKTPPLPRRMRAGVQAPRHAAPVPPLCVPTANKRVLMGRMPRAATSPYPAPRVSAGWY